MEATLWLHQPSERGFLFFQNRKLYFSALAPLREQSSGTRDSKRPQPSATLLQSSNIALSSVAQAESVNLVCILSGFYSIHSW